MKSNNYHEVIYQLAVHRKRSVFPLLHGFDGRLRQNRVATKELEICNISLPIDYGLEKHITSDVIYLGVPWIDRVYFVANQPFSYS